ncbi:DUF3667 domain-containing protein [Rubrivirga sp. IMCC43871]|uniref:DUF3667 domain-containing protein n=1 Tax=Rubrivirga sp. IMCC43871 TaxID=3391575 RepID=UPI00398FEA44
MEPSPLPTLSLAPTGDGAASEAQCLQCGTVLAGPFCHGCGQHESVADRLTFRSLWHDFRVRRLNLHHGLFRTVLDVMRNPGAVARAFVEGRRQTYTHPITLLFVAYALYAVVYGIFEDDLQAMMRAQMESQLAATLPADGGADPAMEFATVAMETTVRVLFTYGAYFTLFIIVPFAALLRWLLADRGRTMAECAVFGAYLEVAVVVPSMLVFVPLSVWLQSAPLSSGGMVLYLVYAGIGARGFFDRRPGSAGLSVLSIVVALAIYLAVFMVAALAIGIWAGWQGAHAG